MVPLDISYMVPCNAFIMHEIHCMYDEKSITDLNDNDWDPPLTGWNSALQN